MTSRTVPLDAPQPDGLTPTENLLVDMAMEALGRSINVSTGALVAAAVITKRGQMFSGGTLTLAIPSAMCAERVAVASAHAFGDLGVTAVALVRASGGPVLPCGACLQLLSDVQTYNRTLITVYSVDAVRERVEIIPLTDLLPRPFRSRKLDQAGGSASPWLSDPRPVGAPTPSCRPAGADPGAPCNAPPAPPCGATPYPEGGPPQP